jgi:hypothetical protein
MTAMTATWTKNPMMAVKQVTMLFSFLLTRPHIQTDYSNSYFRSEARYCVGETPVYLRNTRLK